MSEGKAIKQEQKEERQLSLFANERSEDLSSIIGAAVLMLLIIILV